MPRRLIALALATGCGRIGFDAPTEGASFAARQRIVVHSTQLAQTVDDPFPVFARVGGVDAAVPITPASLRFFARDGATPLPFELEAPRTGAPQLDAWIRAPALPTADDVEIIAMWGDPDLADASSAHDVFGAPFLGVWHLADGVDSSLTANAGTFGGTTLVPGVAGGARDLGGGSMIASAAPLAGLGATGRTTWSAWVRMHTFPAQPNVTSAISLPRENGMGSNDFRFGPGPAGTVEGEIATNPGPQTTYISGGTIGLTWSQIAMVLDGPTLALFVNGRLESTRNLTASMLNVSLAERLIFGADCNGCGGGPPDADQLDGVLDEVRIQAVARGSAWFASEYAMLAGGLVEVGPVEAL